MQRVKEWAWGVADICIALFCAALTFAAVVGIVGFTLLLVGRVLR
jgi:hypothetical protein